ncbi:Heat shock protein ssb1 [Tritrichomonas musculus]|uniref:Heat shock protein ssb1 n=1 Tax=Tritrichomonas musculus TaxID=1915356 RepID=A0ABR2JVP2_9EUKA
MTVDPHCVVGIDLGSTFSTVARLQNNGTIELVKDKIKPTEWIPSVVCYKSDGNVLVGFSALKDERKNPKNVIVDAKRMLGHRYDDSIIQKLSEKWLFDISKASDGKILVNTCQGTKHPWEVCSEIIKYLLKLAQGQAKGYTITHAVVSVPANYSTTQRQETIKAAKAAGLQTVHLISEPTAGVMNYWFSNFNSNFFRPKVILIYDFGGGTLDVSLATVSNNSVEIKAVEGDMLLGGRDFDNNLIDYYLKQKNLKNDILPYLKNTDSFGTKARNEFRLINDQCESAKMNFVNETEQIIMPNIQSLDIEDQELEVSLDTFIQLNQSLINKLLDPVERVLNFSHISKFDVDEILLVGGSSSMPIVSQKLREYFLKEPLADGEPRNVVVRGTAIEARRRFVTNDRDFTELTSLRYQDVCPLSLGTSVIGDKMCVIIPRNSKVPAKCSSSFITVCNFQKQMSFDIYETESYRCTDDCLLGSLSVKLPEKQAGQVTVNLELSLNEDCILTAKCQVEGYYYSPYINEKIIRQGVVLNPEVINNAIKLGEANRVQDQKTVEEKTIKDKWIFLHSNVISFINHFRDSVNKNKKSINEKFDQILAIANSEKQRSCTNKDQLNSMVQKYKQLFVEYNRDAPPNRQADFFDTAGYY